MKTTKTAKTKVLKDRRAHRVRAKVRGTTDRPRLSVYRSLTQIAAQIIDDSRGITLVSVTDLKDSKGNKIERAVSIGKKIAELAAKKKISTIVFDRGGNRYMGRVKALAEAAREAGLKF